MLVVLPFYSKDSWLAAKNLRHWIAMDGKVDYQCLLSYDTETDPTEVRDLAKQYFTRVTEFCQSPPSNRNWPYASNTVFHNTVWFLLEAAKAKKGKPHIEPQSWLWVESDSVAMKPGWIRAIEDCHKKHGMPFTGHWNHNTGVWNGVSVYPPNPNRYTHHMMLCDNAPWDVIASKYDFIEKNLHKANDLFQHIWADPATDKPFSFTSLAEVRAVVRDSVVLFHRCKDGSLIDCLTTGKLEPEFNSAPRKSCNSYLLVIPFCNKDHRSAMLNMELCELMDGKTDHKVLLSYDDATKPSLVVEVDEAARRAFKTVYHYCYDAPREKKWPHPQNHAFFRAAMYVEKHWQGGWFWWEMDAVPLRPGWYSLLCDEYNAGGRPFGGHIVADMGHVNGTAFYPCDILKHAPGLSDTRKAWDVAIRPFAIAKTHKMNHLIQNVWAFDKKGNHTLNSGEVPSFQTDEQLKIVDQTACIFHRCKDGSLQKMLLKKYTKAPIDPQCQTC